MGGHSSGRGEPAPPSPATTPNDDVLSAVLTPREREILALYLELLNPKAVARRLGTRLQTVRNQLASIQHKFGVRSTEELIALALRGDGAVSPQRHS